MRSYFRKIFGRKRIALGRDKESQGWFITCKRIVDGDCEAEILQEVKKRKGKSILQSRMYLSNEAMEELVYMYNKHPDRDRVFKFLVEEDELGQWAISPTLKNIQD